MVDAEEAPVKDDGGIETDDAFAGICCAGLDAAAVVGGFDGKSPGKNWLVVKGNFCDAGLLPSLVVEPECDVAPSEGESAVAATLEDDSTRVGKTLVEDSNVCVEDFA